MSYQSVSESVIWLIWLFIKRVQRGIRQDGDQDSQQFITWRVIYLLRECFTRLTRVSLINSLTSCQILTIKLSFCSLRSAFLEWRKWKQTKPQKNHCTAAGVFAFKQFSKSWSKLEMARNNSKFSRMIQKLMLSLTWLWLSLTLSKVNLSERLSRSSCKTDYDAIPTSSA